MKRIFQAIFILVQAVWLTHSSETFAQAAIKFDYDEFNVSHGLSHNQVFSIVQDTRGFIWMGTEDGLSRFDGYQFKLYKHLEKDSNSLISNEIHALYADPDGSLWIGTNNGVCHYFPERDYFQRFKINYTDSTTLHGNYVSSIHKNADSSIWFTYLGSGVDIIYPDKNLVLHYTMYRNDNYILHNDLISSLVFMPDGNTLLGGREGLQVIHKDKHVLNESEINQTYPWNKSIPKFYTAMFLSNDQSFLWIATDAMGLYKVNLATNTVQPFNISNSSLQSNNINYIYQDSKKNLWFGADALYQLENGSEQIKWYSKKGMYVKIGTNVIFEDSDKSIWIGTTRAGVRKINNEISDVIHFHRNQGSGSIKSDEVLSFAQDNEGDLWLSSGGVGLYKVEFDEKNNYSFIESEVNKKLLGRTVKRIYKDHLGTFWLGAWEGGLIKFNPKLNTYKVFHPKYGNFPSQHVWDITEDSTGNLWLGTLRDGLCYFSPKTEKYTYFKHTENDSTSLVNDDVLSILLDSRKILWVGTGNGLSVLLPHQHSFINHFLIDSEETRQLTTNVILCTIEDSSGNIWLGTKGGGILIIKPNAKLITSIKHLTHEDGLVSDIINSLEQDNYGYVWATTNKGISKIKMEDYSIPVLNASLSLPGVEFLTRSSFKTQQDRLIFGSSTGFYSIDPNNNSINKKVPPVYINELKLLGQPVTLSSDDHILKEPLYLSKEISIPSSYNNYTFEFIALNFNLTERNQYAFKMEGFDEDWNYVGSQRFASYTNLDPGTYTFRVKASNNDNIWNEEGASLIIHIMPHWYQTWWFKVVAAALLILAIVFFIGIRIRSIKVINTRLEQQVKERTAELIERNYELTHSREEYAAQNEELIETQEEILTQRDVVESRNKEILIKNYELEESHIILQNQNEQLDKLILEKDGMINVIAHDLKSPLTQIQGLVELIRKSGQLSIDQEVFIALINKSVHDGSSMINDLLELHGIETLSSKISIKPIPLKEFILNWSEQHKPIARQKNQNIIVTINTPIEIVHSEEGYLSRILDNLVTNAMKFSKRDTTINITINSEKERVNISVKDQGLGISDEDQKHMFIPFKKLSARPTGGEPSSGLGLSIVKLLTEKIKGTIHMKSEVDIGTEFIISLPIIWNA